ncbi:MAG: SDR family oxidoreductase [Gemmatimonadaceae bacterium]|jgi:3-oxoacyl-[acyl-carrier protein] reductase|nr:SDR family oxidoreductase [Gemmatimonadaceae bacterium]
MSDSMSRPLENTVALVTGGARDIGAAIVRTLSAQGAAVVINTAHSMARAEALAAELEGAGGRALAVQADVTDPAAIDQMLSRVRDAFGATIHVLVNNAGGLVARKTMDAMDLAFWREVIDLNLTSVFAVTKAVLPMMPDGGAIVNLSSLAARDGGGGGALAYSSAKGAVLTFTRGLAKELAPRRIRVNCVSPGLIATTFHDTFTAPAVRQAVAGRTAVGREGSAQDVANAVAFLASSASAYITGESLEINGGLYFV